MCHCSLAESCELTTFKLLSKMKLQSILRYLSHHREAAYVNFCSQQGRIPKDQFTRSNCVTFQAAVTRSFTTICSQPLSPCCHHWGCGLINFHLLISGDTSETNKSPSFSQQLLDTCRWHFWEILLPTKVKSVLWKEIPHKASDQLCIQQLPERIKYNSSDGEQRICRELPHNLHQSIYEFW